MNHSLHVLQLGLWKKICFLIDGMAVASTVYALRRENVFNSLEQAVTPLFIDELAAGKNACPGYFHLAFRLLEDQGIVHRHAAVESEGIKVALTQSGQSWLAMIPAYDSVMDFLQAATELTEKDCDTHLPEFFLQGLLQLTEEEQRVRLHVAAPLVGAFLVYLYDHEMFIGEKVLFKAEHLGLPARTLDYCCSMLSDLGWLSSAGEEKWFFTEEGQLLCYFIPQLFYPVSYLKTSQKVPELIFKATQERSEVRQEEESHIDRSLDIRFSGLVYERNFREPVHRILTSLFNAEPSPNNPDILLIQVQVTELCCWMCTGQ